jgi:HSP20 family protein
MEETMRIVRYQHPRALAHRNFFTSPWAGIEDEIDRALDTAFTSFMSDAAPAGAFAHPRVDLYEDKDNFHFRAELPGLKREDIQVEMGDGVLTLSGVRKGFAADGKQERNVEFSRTISVPTRVQEDKIQARYEDGVLTVSLPKAEEVKPKRIAIQVK